MKTLILVSKAGLSIEYIIDRSLDLIISLGTLHSMESDSVEGNILKDRFRMNKTFTALANQALQYLFQ